MTDWGLGGIGRGKGREEVGPGRKTRLSVPDDPTPQSHSKVREFLSQSYLSYALKRPFLGGWVKHAGSALKHEQDNGDDVWDGEQNVAHSA